jgi:4-hydroxythreonine-4-phosphate dehydrogenase
MKARRRPLIAITMGDPAGVGPEVVMKALTHSNILKTCLPLVIGNDQVLRRAAACAEIELELVNIQSIEEMNRENAGPFLIDLPPNPEEGFPIGCVDARCGRASAGYISHAIELAMRHEVDGIATAPINKAAMQLAGIPYRGHTEMLADLTDSRSVVMMLVTPGRRADKEWLRVSHVTTHIPLREVAKSLTQEKVLETTRVSFEGLRQIGIPNPKLALAALNPHASDEGLMGDEEARILQPAVLAAQQQGINIEGPIPADTVFLRALQGEFDAIVALYHDQGHIPAKTHGFERAVNVTLGLPIIRTSVDHGTAFDIAWKGLANEASMVEAILLAAQMADQ